MQNQNRLLTHSRPGAEAGMAYATVAGRADKWFFLNGAAQAERALRAESCLIEPDDGDTVLVCHGGAAGAAYILAVLARATPDQAALTLPGGVSLQTEAGRLRVQADSLDFAARERIAVQAPEVELSGISGSARFQNLETSAQQWRAQFGAVQAMAQSVSSTVGRLVQRARDSFRWIDGVDETRAGRVRAQVDGRYDLRAGHATVRAEGQVKIDGEKIDLG